MKIIEIRGTVVTLIYCKCLIYQNENGIGHTFVFNEEIYQE